MRGSGPVARTPEASRRNPRRFEDVRTRILEGAGESRRVERVGIAGAVRRVVAREVIALRDVPATDRSAMDGYACRRVDVESGRRSFDVVGVAGPGERAEFEVGSGDAAEISTGATLPRGADFVLPREFVDGRHGSTVRIASELDARDHVRRRGEESRRGHVLAPPGRVLDAFDVAHFATSGVTEVEVVIRPRVALMSIGSELDEIGHRVRGPRIPDSNRFVLAGRLRSHGCEIVDLGIVDDDPRAIRRALRASRLADVLISTGSTCDGTTDRLREAVDSEGRVEFVRTDAKPCKPVAFGHVGETRYIGLPGNPIAALVGFEYLVRPLVGRMTGAPPPTRVGALAANRVQKRLGRLEFRLATPTRRRGDRFEVRIDDGRSSDQWSRVRDAIGFVSFSPTVEVIEPGDVVHVQRFTSDPGPLTRVPDLSSERARLGSGSPGDPAGR